MKIWKIIRAITVIVLICFIGYITYRGIIHFLAGNYYSDSIGIITYYWYERFEVELALYCYAFGIPFLIDVVLLIISIIKIKKFNKIDNMSEEKGID